jgi:hypothetical protein
MSGVADHPVHVGLLERLKGARFGVGFVEPEQDFPLLRGLDFLALDQFMPVIVKPASKPPALFWRQGFDGGFQLFHAHAMNLHSIPPIANPNFAALVAQVLQEIFDERLHLRRITEAARQGDDEIPPWKVRGCRFESADFPPRRDALKSTARPA